MELESSKYYVGKSDVPIQRVEDHNDSKGSTFTKKYKPIRLIELIPDCDTFDEDKYTLKYMQKYGMNNVRGGSFCQIKLSPENSATIQRMITGSQDKCFKCGKDGHYMKQCPKKKKIKRPKKKTIVKQAPHTAKTAQIVQPYWMRKLVVECVVDIVDLLRSEKEIQINAYTQSGKSDIIINLANRIQNKELRTTINIRRMIVVICASDNDLKRDLKQKIEFNVPKSICIFHLGDIQAYLNNDDSLMAQFFGDLESTLLIFDESHCDIKNRSIVDRFRSKIGIKWANWDLDAEEEIKVINFSATPYEHIYAGIPHIELKTDSEYWGLKEMMIHKKIFESKNLVDRSNVTKFLTRNDLYLQNGYVVIRLPSDVNKKDIVMKNIRQFFALKGVRFDEILYDMEYADDINDVLSVEPLNLTIIYIKDKMRKGKTIIKHNILAMYDRKSMQPSTTIQGLVGRATGYAANRELIVYTNVDHVKKHLIWCESNYAKNKTPYSQYIRENGLKKTNVKYDEFYSCEESIE